MKTQSELENRADDVQKGDFGVYLAGNGREECAVVSADYYKSAGMTLHARACAMAYTAEDYDVCEGKSCVTRAKCWACAAEQSGQGAIEFLLGLMVVAVITLGMALLFGQYHAGNMFAYLPH